MKLLFTFFFTLTFIYSFSQDALVNMVSQDGGPTIQTIELDRYDRLDEVLRSRWLQKDMDPGVIPEGDYMGQAVFSPGGEKIYLSNRGTDYLSIFDWSSMSADTNIKLGDYPSCIDANANFIVVGCQFSDRIYILDAATYAILDSLPVFEQPCRIHISPVADIAYVACDIEDVCLEIDLQSLSVTDTIEDFPIYLQTFSWSTQSGRNWIKYSDFAVTPDGTGLIIHNGQDQLQYFDVASGTVTNTVPIANPRAFNFSGDQASIVCAANPDNVAKLYQVSFPGFLLEDSVEVAGYSLSTNEVVVNQDGSKAYIGTGNNTSTLVKFNTHDFKTFTGTYTAFWLGISPDHRYVVSGQNHFSIVDMETENVTDMYTGLNQSWGLVSPVGNYVFSYDPLLYEGAYYFDFSDPSNIQYLGSSLSGELPEGDAPYRVAMLNSNYKAVTVNNLSYNCSLIDYENNEVIGTVDLGEACYDVIITQDDNYAVCGGYNNHTVKIIDIPSMELIAEVNTGQRPMELTYARMLNRVYAANIQSNSISVIQLDGASSSLLANVPCGVIGVYIPFFGIRSGVEISPTEDYLLVAASFDDKLKIMDTETNQIVADLSVGDFPLAIAFNHDGTRACVSNLFDHTYSIIRVDGAASEVIITNPAVGEYPVDVSYNEEEDLFYICNYYTKGVITVDPENGDLVDNINLNAYGGAFQVEFANGTPVYLTVGTDVVSPGVLYNDTLFELPASPARMDLVTMGSLNGCAGVAMPGPDFLTVVNLDVGVGINIPLSGEKEMIRVYPNPADGMLFVEAEENISEIRLSDAQGRTVIDTIINDRQHRLDVSRLEPGVYVVSVSLASGEISKSRVIVR
ncbi:MAG: T9SS type A sorting domain-containing protein [Bacteroidetes bacterium]|nr:T9SS type A sorting domain-containing protein [Bacteroidota bacterium]